MSSFCLKLISKFHYNLPLYQACQEVPGYSRGTRLVRTRVARRYQVTQEVPGYLSLSTPPPTCSSMASHHLQVEGW
ncbi:hypothetical protein XENTR_v10015827 [Xenopus tropicalis]|nr:hypothetical protein XENTR_v10015827 [Xenopus tropicalis]